MGNRKLLTAAAMLISMATLSLSIYYIEEYNTTSYPMANVPAVEIKIGEKAISFAQRNRLQMKIDRQPAGLNFYEIRFPSKRRGKAIINFGEKKLVVDNVISIMATEDVDLKNEGLADFHINAAITENDLVPHDEARLKLFSILNNMLQLGWKPRVHRGIARLRGKDMMDYLLVDKKYTTLDPSYIPSFDEWMRMDNLTSWDFYAHRIFLDVAFTRESTLTDPTKPGAYLLSYDLKSDVEYYRGYAGARREKWKELLPGILANLAKHREKMETELRAKGKTIDVTYTDPPIPH